MTKIDLIDSKGNITEHLLRPDFARTYCGIVVAKRLKQDASGNGRCRSCERIRLSMEKP